MEPSEITTLKQLEEEVSKVYLLADPGVVALLCATVVANRLKLDPVWLMLVAPSSGGKSELISALGGLKFIHSVSDLTINSMASGFKGKPGEETSLLWKANYGILTFKDFTTILSKDRESKAAIMGQFREIYDGKYDKTTGNGKNINWKGKIGAIAGATEMVYEAMQDLSAMGDRFVMYSIEQPDRLEVARRVLENTGDMTEKRKHIQDCFTAYLTYVLDNVSPEKPKLPEVLREELLQVADFATRARSAVLTDFKSGAVTFVPSAEMPTRVTSQLYNLASAFLIMKKADPEYVTIEDDLAEKYKNILYKVAMDSIPKKRRMALQALAGYEDGVSSGGLATMLAYPTETVKKWFYALNGLGICERSKGRSNHDTWSMRKEYRAIVQRFDKVRIIQGALRDDSDDDFDNYMESDEDTALLTIQAKEQLEQESLNNQREAL